LAACIGCKAPSVDAPSPSPAPSSAASAARSTSPTLPAAFDVAAIDAYLAGQVAARGFVGLSVAIVRDGSIVLEKGYGQRELAPDAPVQTDTAFEIGSISKQFVSALVLLLAQEKMLSIDDPVAKYFPDLTRAKDITLYDLMTHVSGYRDDYPLDFVDKEMTQPVTPDESIVRYAGRPLDFEPRTRWSYSSTGYKILGRVVEKVTGKPLATVLEERILRPVGMTHSSYMPVAATPGLARGYTSFAMGPPEPAEPEASGWVYGGGGLHAPAGDIARWDIALMSGKVLGPEAYRIFSTPRTLADGRPTTYGCGIVMRVSPSGETVLRHSGADSGFVAYSVLVPRTRSAVVALSNRDDVDPRGLVNDVLTLLDAEHRPRPPIVAGPSSADVARVVFAQLQSGRVDRSLLGDDFNAFLTDAKVKGASARLGALGAPTNVVVDDTSERGGMEVATVTFSFAEAKIQATMFRSVDGRVQEFLVHKR
jgi:CubicO group peptidase (beta-lactamase class C family)